MTRSDQLEKHSLILMAATLVGHAGNYLYHVLSGRLLSDAEYGLLMALFGLVNMLLLPMSALGLALTRAVAADVREHQGAGRGPLLRIWTVRLLPVAAAFPLAAWLASPWLRDLMSISRIAPLILATLIPALNLLLTLSGSALQGTQRFTGLALRGSLLFTSRALLAAGCLVFGFAAAGWALLAHLLGMMLALGLSIWLLRRDLRHPGPTASLPRPVLRTSLGALPILLSYAILMTADVVLIRHFLPEDVSGQFAKAATLARMILWLPIPVAQAMFPKVVRNQTPSSRQRRTLRKALLYTLFLSGGAYLASLVFAPLALHLVYGMESPSAETVSWLRRMAGAMALLAPVYVLMHFELARERFPRLMPICLCAAGYLGWIIFGAESVTADTVIGTLRIAAATAFAFSLLVLREKKTSLRKDPSPPRPDSDPIPSRPAE